MTQRQTAETRFGYPRPQLRRDAWLCLNGSWQFAMDEGACWSHFSQVKWDRTIEVPFAVEAPLSGIGDEGFHPCVWYRRGFNALKRGPDERVLLHFEAVDYIAEVWVNGQRAMCHEGGYTPFSADITDLLIEGEQQQIIVRARDDPADLCKPRGKQDWQLKPHVIWYPRSTGIWQSVWLEMVNATRLESIRFIPDVPNWRIGIQAEVHGTGRQSSDCFLQVRLCIGGKILADDRYGITDGRLDRQIALPADGIARDILWHPDHPHLIDAELTLFDAGGEILDRVQSYTAMRSVEARDGRFLLNGLPISLRLILNQGYWPDGGQTAPDDDALKRDVELIKQMGFNGVRLHQKIECRRFLHWADKLGLMVWGEMPSAYAFSSETMRRVTNQWTEAIQRDVNHPCVIAWVPFNESWGLPDLPDRSDQRDFLRALYYLTRSLDPSRPVSGNDGWMMDRTDLIGVHDYHHDPQILRHRYQAEPDDERKLIDRLRRLQPAGRPLFLDAFQDRRQPLILSECGGIALASENDSWGYSRANSSKDLADRYGNLMVTLRSIPNLAGFCYTQFTDTYQEANGLLTMDRSPKVPLEVMAVATRGASSDKERRIESLWQHHPSAPAP